MQPRGEGGGAAIVDDAVHEFQKDLLGDIYRRPGIAAKEMERHGVDMVLVGLIQLAPGLAIAPLACRKEFRPDAAG